MKVLFISNDPQLADSGSRVRVRMSAYAKAIGTLHVLTRSSGTNVVTDGSLTVHNFACPKSRGWKKLASYAHELIMKENIEIVSCQDPFEYGFTGMRAVRGTSAKLHIQVHTDFLSPWFTRGGIFRSPQVAMPLKNALRRRVASRVLPHADGIRVVSGRVCESLKSVYGTKIVEPVILPIAPQSAPPPKIPFPFETFPFTLVTVGRLEPEKRIDDILNALSRLRDSYPMIGLVVIGSGREHARLQKLVQELELQSKVVFITEHVDAWGLMQSADAYIQASAYEGYGITLIEAALARVPIITSDVGIIGEVLTGFDDVLVSPPGDPTNLAYHIVSLIEDPASKEVRAHSAQVKAQAHVKAYQDLPALIASDLARLL